MAPPSASPSAVRGPLQFGQLLLRADRDQHMTDVQRRLHRGIGEEHTVVVAEREDKRPRAVAYLRLKQRTPGQPGAGPDGDLFEPELQAAVMHYHVEEF